MDNKQLYEKQANSYNPIFPIVRLEDIIETISDKSIQWILNNYNHIYVEYSESVEITRNKVPSLLRRNGLWITYNTGKEIITEYYKGSNNDVLNYTQWTLDDNWERFDKLKYADGSITYQHLSDAVKQLLGSGNTITNYPDDEDLTVDGINLKLKDREYDKDNFSGLGRIILRKNIMTIDGQPKNILSQDMINKENTIYEIRYDFDLNGNEITIPEGCVLDFQGGKFINGSIKLSNYSKLCGNPIFEYNIDSSLIHLYRDSYISTPIYIEDSHNIEINNTKIYFSGNIENYKYTIGGISIFGKDKACYNIFINNCELYRCRISFWGNVYNSSLINSELYDVETTALDIETLYYKEPYNYPHNISIINNKFFNEKNYNKDTLIWISGTRDLLFINNYIESCKDAIMLYCGDGNINLENIIFERNIIKIKNYQRDTLLLSITGKSFVYFSKDIIFGKNIKILNNVFVNLNDEYLNNSEYICDAIVCSFLSDIFISNNKIIGFSRGIVLRDTFKSDYHRMTNCIIKNNTIENIYYRAIEFGSPIESLIIDSNIFKNINIGHTTYEDKCVIDLRKRRNIIIKNNIFKNDNLLNFIINAQYAVNCVITNNITNDIIIARRTTADYSSNIIQNEAVLIGKNKYFYDSNLSDPGSFKKDDIINLYKPEELKTNYVNKIIKSYIITEEGSITTNIDTAINCEVGNNYFSANTSNSTIRCGMYLNIDNTIYKIIDIDYYENKYYLNSTLHKTLINYTPSVKTPSFSPYEEIETINKVYGTERPLKANAGDYFFDLNIVKPIWYTGTRWVDATGADV